MTYLLATMLFNLQEMGITWDILLLGQPKHNQPPALSINSSFCTVAVPFDARALNIRCPFAPLANMPSTQTNIKHAINYAKFFSRAPKCDKFVSQVRP